MGLKACGAGFKSLGLVWLHAGDAKVPCVPS